MGVAEKLDYMQDLASRRLPESDLCFDSQPPLSHVRLLQRGSILGGNAALRELIDQGARAEHAHRARRRVQSRQPWLLPVQPHAGKTARLRLTDWFYFNEEWLKAGRPLTPIREGRQGRAEAAWSNWVLGVVGFAAAAQAQHPHARRARVYLARGGILG